MCPLDPERLDWIRRHSRVQLDREGGWTFEERPVENRRVSELFHRGVRTGEAEGEFILQVGEQWCFIETVEDTAFFVSKLTRKENGTLEMTLLGGEVVGFGDTALSQAGDVDVYASLPDGRRARLLRDAVAALAPLLVECDGGFGIALDGQTRPISVE